jgi:hypothetical protein
MFGEAINFLILCNSLEIEFRKDITQLLPSLSETGLMAIPDRLSGRRSTFFFALLRAKSSLLQV